MRSILSKISFVIFISILLVSSFAFADTNGIWHKAEDVRPGIFGGDESYTSAYSFVNEVIFNSPIHASIINASLIYDSDNSSYYLDPDLLSVFNDVNVKGELSTNVIRSNRADGNVIIQLG